jgi:hypothetical protein
MIKVDIRGDFGKTMLASVQRDLRPKVIQPALNKMADKVKADLARAIPAEYNVKASEVRSAVDIRKARSGSLEAVVTIFGSSRQRGRSLNLIHFLAAIQATGRAINVRGGKGKKSELAALQKQLGFLIKRGGGLKKIEGAFVGNKGWTIFMREGPGRLPIKPVQVIGFAQMFRSRKIERRIMDKIAAEMPAEINSQIKRLFSDQRPI